MRYSAFPSLSEVLRSGLPSGDQVLVSGPPGSGKSILSMRFLVEGAKAGEKGIYFTLESRRDYIIEQMEGLGMEVRPLLEKGLLEVVELDASDIYVLLDDMSKRISAMEASRMVLDSLSILYVYCSSYRNLPEDMIAYVKETQYPPPISMGDSVKKQMLYHVLTKIRALGCTSLLVSELSKDSRWYSRDRTSEFFCDGIILLDYHVLGGAGVTRTLSIVKMRRSPFTEGVHEFTIGEGGLKLGPL